MIGLLKNLLSSRIPNSEVKGGDPAAVLTVSLIFDVSGSMVGEKIDQAKYAASNLVTNLNEDVEVGLIAFGGKARLVSGLTHNFDAVEEKIRSLDVGGRTPLMEALELSEQFHIDKSKTDSCIVVDTDGHPNDAPTEEILAKAGELKKGGSEIFTIGIGEMVDDGFLKKLASSRDNYFYAEAPDLIKDKFQKVKGILRTLE